MSEIYEAKLDDFTLEIETIEDSFEKAIQKDELPHRDGALTDDLGEKAHTIRIRCYFYGENYEQHFAFLNHLSKRELFELIHPKYGLLKGRIESVAVRHDDRTETAEVDISFVEHLRGAIVPTLVADVELAAEDAFVEGQSELQDETQKSFFGKARGFMAQIEKYKRRFDSILKDIANPANSIINMVNYAADTPGDFVKSIALCVERYAELYSTLKDAPTRFLSSMQSAVDELSSAFRELFTKGYQGRSAAEYEAAQFADQFARVQGALRMEAMMAKCKARVETYSRIVGYFRPVQQWNDGKQEEFKDRKLFSIKKALEAVENGIAENRGSASKNADAGT